MDQVLFSEPSSKMAEKMKKIRATEAAEAQTIAGD